MATADEVRAAVRAELHAQGFCVLPNLVPTTKLARIAAAYDRAFGEAAAHGQPAVAGPDHHRGRAPHGQLTLTVTAVGLVRMS